MSRISVRHVGIVCHDVESCLNFWIHVLGFDLLVKSLEDCQFISRALNIQDVMLTTYKLSDGNGFIVELLDFHDFKESCSWSGGVNSVGLTHVALSVPSVDALYEEICARGFSSLSKPSINPQGTHKVCFIQGPELLLLEIVEQLRT